MGKPRRHRSWLRRLRFWAGALIAAVIIALATAMALGQILLPLAARYPARVEALLSHELGRPVRFARMQGVWRPGGPELTLYRLSLANPRGGPALNLAQATLRFSFGRLFWPGRHWIELSAHGLSLDVARSGDGRWQVAGFAGGALGSGGSGLASLPVDIKLTGLSVAIRTEAAGPLYHLDADAVLLSDRDDTLRFGATLRRPGMRHDLRVAGRFASDGASGTLYVQGLDMDFASLLRAVQVRGYALRGGAGNLRAWLHWRHGRLQAAQLDLALRDLALDGPAGRSARLPQLAGMATLRKDDGQWHLRYEQPAQRGAATGGWLQAVLQVRPGGAWWRLQAEHLHLGALLPLAGLLPQAPPRLSRWLAQAAPQGEIAALDLRWYGAGAWALRSQITALRCASDGLLPGVDALSGHLDGDAQALVLRMPAQPFTLRYPHVFAQPLVFDRLGGTFALRRDAAGWHIGIGALDFAAAKFAGAASGSILLRPGQPRPVLDVYAALRRGEVAAAKLFWPINKLSPKARAWLDRALVAGAIESGRVVFRGDTRDWPFRDDQGQFQALARFSEATLDYDPHWPAATDLAGRALFENTGLTVEADRGSVLGNPLRHAVARISDLGHATLALAAEGQGQAADLLSFVRKSPISNDFRDGIAPLQVQGRAAWRFTLVLPVGDVRAFALEGQAQLQPVALQAPQWKLAVRDITGTLHFDRGGIHASDLAAQFRKVPVQMALAAGADTGDVKRLFQARMQGNFDAATLLEGIDALQPYVPRLIGSAPVTLGLDVDRAASGQPPARTLLVQSDLTGMRLQLPTPLDKPAAAALPLRLRIGLPFAGGSLDGQLGAPAAPLLHLRGRLPQDGEALALAIGLGVSAPPALPAGSDGGLALAGSTPRLDVSGWAMLGAGGKDGRRWPLSGSIATAQGLLFGRPFADLQLRLRSDAQGLQVLAASPALAGTLRLPQDLQKNGIHADLQRLYWPAEGDSSEAGTAPAPAPMAQVDPGALPPLDLQVADFHLGAAQFGAAHFLSTPMTGGMRIEQLQSKSANVSMSAQGTWTGTAADNRTQMRIAFHAEDLGRMLEALGYQNLVAGGRTVADLDASWRGAPSAFALDALDGTLKADVTEGRILEVKPGAGRLLGLFSIAELPRRLAFDFGDVFRKGFAFDSIRGTFTLGDGNAITHDLEIRGPAADIKVDGRTGLRAHDYDEIVSVYPKLGSTLPVIGAVAGGPVGAVAGLALQGLLGSGLSQASGSTYKVTGSWDKPLIVKINAAPAQPARAASSKH